MREDDEISFFRWARIGICLLINPNAPLRSSNFLLSNMVLTRISVWPVRRPSSVCQQVSKKASVVTWYWRVSSSIAAHVSELITADVNVLLQPGSPLSFNSQGSLKASAVETSWLSQ